MSMSRQQLKRVAIFGLVLCFGPLSRSPEYPLRVVAQRDPAFVVPDSVRALLTLVTSIVVGPDQSVYLADRGLATILNLDSSGAFRSAIGRRGQGPGEFQSVLILGLHNDSLWAMDPALIRLTLMPLHGRGSTTVPFFSSAPTLEKSAGPQSRWGMPAAVLPDGSLLVQENVLDSTSPVGDLSHGFLLRTRRSMEVIDTVAHLPLGHTAMNFVYRDGATSHSQPFNDDPLYSASTDGSVVVTVNRVAHQGRGEPRFTVTAWKDGTQRLFSREYDYRPRRLRESAVDSAAEQLAVPMRGAEARSPVTADSIRRRMFRPAYFPPVQEVRVSRAGEVWLKVCFADSPPGVGDWLVLSRHGFEVNRVTLPPSFRLLEADRKTIWGVEGDPLDVPLVVRYQVPSQGV
jgi:hypothetical protein